MRKHYPLNAAGVEDAGLLPWTDGVPATGVEGSYPGHALITDTESEVLAAAAAAGLVPSSTDLTQLAQAISRGVFLGGFAGSANALSASLPNSVVFPSLLPGMRFQGIALASNTGAVTLTLSGIAAPPGSLNLLRSDGGALQAGDVRAGSPFFFIFDGAAFRMAVPTQSEMRDAAPIATTVIEGAITQTFNNLLITGGRTTVFATPGAFTWTAPAGATQARVIALGGGGGGGGSANSGAGGGGGGGGYVEGVVPVVAGQVYTGLVGAGGIGGRSNGQASTAGGTSTFTAGGKTLSATGGTGGTFGNGTTVGITGQGGNGVGGDLNFSGSIGQNGIYVPTGTANDIVFGGIGGGSRYSPSTVYPYGLGAFNGVAPGGGGSGAAGTYDGGNGFAGIVIIMA